MLVQHIHMCVWPHLISPFISMGTGGSSTKTQHQERRGSGKDQRRKAPPSQWKVEVTLDTDNVSLAMLDNPSDTTSYGVCAEVRSIAR